MRLIATSGRARPRRARQLIAGVLLAAATSVVLGAGAPPVAADSPATAVLDWNKHALDALHNPPTVQPPGAGLTPPVQAVHMAMVQGAVYDAVNSIARGSRVVPGCAARTALGLPGCRDRHCCARRAGLGAESGTADGYVHRSGSAVDHRPSRPTRGRVARGGDGRRRRRGCGGRNRRRRRGSCRHDRRPHWRRPLGPVPLHVRRGAGPVATGHLLGVHDALGPE